MKIYIVRHGQTLWNEEGRMQGIKNSSLTERGILEAKKLNDHIKDLEFDRIYVSPLGRTIETMNHIKGDRDIPVTVLEELQEMDFGEFEGKVLEDLKKSHPETIYNLWENPRDYVNETGENYIELFSRVRNGIEKIIKNKDKEKRVLVITHGVVISSILTMVKGKPMFSIWETPVVKNTSLSILKCDDSGELNLLKENIIDHLG